LQGNYYHLYNIKRAYRESDDFGKEKQAFTLNANWLTHVRSRTA